MFKQDQEVFNLLLGAISEGVIIVDEDQNIVETNNFSELMFGYGRKELIKQPLNILIPQNYRSGHGSHFKGFMKDKMHRQMGQGRNLYGVKKDRSIFPIEAGLNQFTIYGKNYVMAIVMDVSVRKEQEKKIKEFNSHLEEKVDNRTKELKIAINDLKITNSELAIENKKRIHAEKETKRALIKEKELSELKTKFLSLVSHEFKTPLSGISTSVMLLSKYKLEQQQDKRDKHIKIITDKVYFLNTILNDFLSVEKLERGHIKYTPQVFKLSKVVNEVVYNANMLLKDGQKISYPDDIDELSLVQDEKILELILSNLVQNAIKYSSENTIIDIDITQGSNTTMFRIKDSGIGIPKKDQKNIFSSYFRAENALLTQGTGIGLSIVKDHLDNLKGSISFESIEGKGSVFTMKLPNIFER